LNDARRRLKEATDELLDRRFSTARRADDGYELPSINLEIEVVEYLGKARIWAFV
jgi:hypothetical protein